MAEGWVRDPSGRYDERLFAEGRPTRFVRSAGVDLLDPISDDEAALMVEDQQVIVEHAPPLPEPRRLRVTEAPVLLDEATPFIFAVPPPPQQESSPQQPTAPSGGWRAVPPWRWLLAAGVFILVAVAMLSAVLYISHAGPFRKAAPNTLIGSVTLLHQSVRGDAGINSCVGYGGFKEVVSGAEVVVTADRKKTAGTALLSTGLPKNVVQRGPFVVYDCVFQFSVPRVAKASFYSIKVGPYSGATVAYSQLSAQKWSLPLRMQSSAVPGGAPQLRPLALPAPPKVS